MSTSLTRAVIELESHVAANGWDQPTRLFALVDTAALVAAEPALAATLAPTGPDADPAAAPASTYTSIEQELPPDGVPLDEMLAHIAWPETVAGAAVAVERLMLPPSVEAELDALPADGAVPSWVAEHPERQEVRIVVAVLRDGARETALRLRSHDADDAVLSGASLVPNLASALALTFED